MSWSEVYHVSSVACVAMCRGKSMQNVASAHLRYWGCQESPAQHRELSVKSISLVFLLLASAGKVNTDCRNDIDWLG